MRPKQRDLSAPPKRSPLTAGFEKKFLESELRFDTLVKHLPVGVYRTTPAGRIIEANPALSKILGYSRRELKAINVRDLYIKKAERDRQLQKLVTTGVPVIEFQLRRKDRRVIWVRDETTAVAGPAGTILYYDGILIDASREKKATEHLKKALVKLRAFAKERQEMVRKLENASITDDLTGLYNRRGFYTISQEYLSYVTRKKSKMFLLFMDMDHLKRINDTFGHHVGDQALIQMAKILRNTFRTSDVKGRMGGDEFAVFPIDSTYEGVEIAVARLESNIKTFNETSGAPYKLSISTGVTGYDPGYPSSLEELLIRADKLMYERKSQKKAAKAGLPPD
jgi:diguanylate cyclase (GGDEF)-like protein/PAS domain S-box-containing protein